MERAGTTPIDFKDLFDYLDGFIFWANPRNKRSRIGSIAGSLKSNGYWQVLYEGTWYQVNRVIWEMHNGPIPEGMEVDHRDLDKENNRIGNLRLLTRAENAHHRSASGRSDNKLGVRGVSESGNKYVAYIHVDGVTKNLGYFNSIPEASAAYDKGAREFFPNVYN